MKTGSYFPHDSNAKDDPKCMLLIDQLGLEGYGIFWILIETLRDQPNFSYPLSHTSILAKRYNTSKEKIETVIYNFNLFTINNDLFFYSESLINRMGEIANKKLKQSEGGKKGMLNRWKNNQLQLTEKENNNNLVITNLEKENNLLITSKVKESKVKEKNIYAHPKDFYLNELQCTDADSEIMGYYSKFVDILLGKNDLNRELTELLNLENQVSYRQFSKLLKKSQEKKKKFSTILTQMTNDKKYYIGKKSLYLCLNTWLNSNY
jgi:hypothetical protein